MDLISRQFSVLLKRLCPLRQKKGPVRNIEDPIIKQQRAVLELPFLAYTNFTRRQVTFPLISEEVHVEYRVKASTAFWPKRSAMTEKKDLKLQYGRH